MPRRSSRLAGKKKVDYNVDNYFDRVLGTVKRGWQKTVDRLEAKPSQARRPVTKIPKTAPFKKKQPFRKKAQPAKRPTVPKEIVRLRATRPKREPKREVIDLTTWR